jgi:hypothetical protein
VQVVISDDDEVEVLDTTEAPQPVPAPMPGVDLDKEAECIPPLPARIHSAAVWRQFII